MEEIIKKLYYLDTSKATQKFDIPIKLIKENYGIFSKFLYENFNSILETGNFPQQLKLRDVKPINKKKLIGTDKDEMRIGKGF